ncbi:hypothetical protein O6H91_15G067000 [Diphasiastrum complanatum]|uniref:Uncharacterized protein n=1 Tax=Diphasiastrum complanatum TaxID=34168 RepID=A0ACC2BJ57_DIPCM|nr:hypothetical protein O6H91_15G067000 [Diphasiastrum complanatum]
MQDLGVLHYILGIEVVASDGPLELVSDRRTHFLNETVRVLLAEFLVVHRKSMPYYPRCNGQAESSNKILCNIITKIVEASRSDWEHKLQAALWAFRTTYKLATGHTPFQLVYGLEAIMPVEFIVPSRDGTIRH